MENQWTKIEATILVTKVRISVSVLKSKNIVSHELVKYLMKAIFKKHIFSIF